MENIVHLKNNQIQLPDMKKNCNDKKWQHKRHDKDRIWRDQKKLLQFRQKDKKGWKYVPETFSKTEIFFKSVYPERQHLP